MIWNKRKQTVFLATCLTVVVFSTALAQTAQPLTNAQKTELQQQLDEIEKQIAVYQQQLNQIQGDKKTLQNKVNQLKKQQATLGLQIQATTLEIADINSKLADTSTTIETNTEKIVELRKKLSSFLGVIYQQDDYSLLYLLLSKDNLSDVLSELETSSQISQSLHDLVQQNAEANNLLKEEQDALADQQDQANNLLSVQALQKQQLASSVNDQNTLLNATKGQEANYQAVLSNTQAQAAQIRGRLYDLLGISHDITFGQAVEIAQWASGQTGVRAAFLLAILTQESNLGKNVGTCNRAGDPPTKSYTQIMKPDRDIQPFLAITQSLGMDPNTTPVSCPMSDKAGNRIGWGGAMGPAQFIPSTWMGYKDKVMAITGKTANPWDIRDAFLAAAIKLKAGGAGSVDGEWAAAMRYFSGGTDLRYRFYGDNV
ncbi:MAG TPA: hypothetical protein VL306_02180, partial [Methylomirabilota bacterium]|nr:hypothetical protein [Methylomirabilota bacterium]